MVLFEQFLDEAISSIMESSSPNKDFKFNGKTYTVKIKNKITPKHQFIPNIDEIESLFNSTKLWEHLYKSNTSWWNEVSEDDQYGIAINSARDLKSSVTSVTTIIQKQDGVYVCGEWKVDPEHGFSVNFPNGKLVTSGKNKTGIGTMDQAL